MKRGGRGDLPFLFSPWKYNINVFYNVIRGIWSFMGRWKCLGIFCRGRTGGGSSRARRLRREPAARGQALGEVALDGVHHRLRLGVHQ